MRLVLNSVFTATILCTTVASTKADKIDDYLKLQMRQNHIPSISVAILRNGKVEKLKSYGLANLEWNGSATPDTPYQIASTTKPLTGTALMLLVQEGKIRLEDSITKYIPDAPPAWQPITVRHLVSHTAGLKEDLGKEYKTVEEAVTRLTRLPLDYPPGERSSYGLTGYMVLTHIIEKVTGKSFPQFLQDRLFTPLGMKSTGFDYMEDQGPVRLSNVLPHRAVCYSWSGSEQKESVFPFSMNSYSAGGLYTTTADLARWIAAIDRGELLSAKNLEVMWTPAKLNSGTSGEFGIGWVVKKYHGRKIVGHSGGPALSDVLRFVDDKLTIIVLTNQRTMYPYLAQGVADMLIPASTPQRYPEITEKDSALSQQLRTLLIGMTDGKVDEKLFAPDSQREFVPALKAFLVPYARSLSPIESFILIEDKREGDVIKRRYQARYGQKTVLWTFNLNKVGQVLSLGPDPE